MANEILKQRLADRLQDNDKMKQVELANQMGISDKKMSRIASGKQEPSTEELKSMCTILGCTSDYMIGMPNEDNPTRAQTDICKKTGLSPKAVGRLIDLKYVGAVQILDTISYLLEKAISDEDIKYFGTEYGYMDRNLFGLIASCLGKTSLTINGENVVAIELPSTETELYTVSELYFGKAVPAIISRLSDAVSDNNKKKGSKKHET